jgi:hypothetical protein
LDLLFSPNVSLIAFPMQYLDVGISIYEAYRHIREMAHQKPLLVQLLSTLSKFLPRLFIR